MPRSRSRSPRRGYDRHQRKRSRSPYQASRRHRSRSRSPRRRRRSKSRSPPPRRPRSPFGGRSHYGRGPKDDADAWKTPANPANMTLGGSLGVTLGTKPKKKKQKQKPVMTTTPEDMTDEDKMMQEIMGFQGFDSTKGKKVSGNNVYAINKKVERKYRQYMNRKGGFNRPLDFMP